MVIIYGVITDMEEEKSNVFYPHYEISILIAMPYLYKKVKMGDILSPIIVARQGSIRYDTIKKWCDENLGEDCYHIGIDVIVVYNEVDAMAVKLRWK